MRPHAKVLSIAAVVLALGAAALAAASAKGRDNATAEGRDYAAAAYRGLAAWVDVYDHGPWERPERTVRRMARRGVGTLFLQTSSYRLPGPLHRPAALTRLLDAAERHGIRTVAWYLPGLADPGRDWRRVRAAVTHVTAAGHRFDGFAMDIEATVVRDIRLRNRRMLELSRRLRRFVGPDASLYDAPITSPAQWRQLRRVTARGSSR